MILKCYIQGYGDTLFNIESGCVFTDNLNEKLNSISFNITNEPTSIDFEPYQYVRVIDVDRDYSFDKYFIIDTFTKQKLNLNNEVYYDYSIVAMSETKILEKIVLPNRTIVHGTTQKTIAQVIRELCELYVPTIKIGNATNFSYLPIFSYDSVVSNEKFNVPCPDMSWSCPTLREALSSLFSVVGCIPIINARRLSYIDLRKEFGEVDTSNKHLIYSSSNSSASFTNTLVSFVKNGLDTENNVVYDEIVGFRDNENAIIKQLENLYLETQYPIAEVKELSLRVPYKLSFTLHDTNLNQIALGNVSFMNPPYRMFKVVLKSNGLLKEIKWVDDSASVSIQNLDITCYKMVSNVLGQIKIEEVSNFEVGSVLPNGSITIPSGIECHFAVISGEYGSITFRYNTLDNIGFANTSKEDIGVDYIYPTCLYAYQLFDITKLVKEKQVRNALDVDVLVGRNYSTLDEFATFYYSTLEYTYNKNRISGFSSKFDWFEWYGQNANTFMEIIFDLASQNAPRSLSAFASTSELASILKFDTSSTLIATSDYPSEVLPSTGQNKYSLATFKLSYVPFNQMQIRYSKANKSIAYPLETISNQDNSIVSLDSFSEVESEKINRFSNNVFSISEPNTSFSGLIELGQELDDHLVIFERQIEIYKDFVNATYSATKNYILRNFFTSIVKKYRAYEYFNVDNTIVRDENKHYFIDVYTSTSGARHNDILDISLELDSRSIFASGLFNNYEFASVNYNKDYALNYLVVNDVSNDKYYKYQVSKLASGNSILISYQEPYSNSFGNYIDNTYDALGGWVQGRYIFNSEYYDSHSLYFANSIYNDFGSNIKENGLNEDFLVGGGSHTIPKVLLEKKIFTINDRLYYKSLNERINETIQFEYYSATPKLVNFTKALLERNILLGLKESLETRVVRASNESEVELSEYSRTLNSAYEEDITSSVSVMISSTTPSTTNLLISNVESINKDSVLKLCLYKNGEYQDLVGFVINANETSITLTFEVCNRNNNDFFKANATSGILEKT